MQTVNTEGFVMADCSAAEKFTVSELSSRYAVRKMTVDDVDRIYELSAGNPLYFRHCPPFVTKESILRDMKALPPGVTYEDKFYIGFFKETEFIAIMDLILNYPDTQTAFIGLFMVAGAEQGKGTGSMIVKECFCYIQSRQYRFIRLGYAKGNPQSEAFWKKNGFGEVGIEIDNGDYTVVVLQKELQES